MPIPVVQAGGKRVLVDEQGIVGTAAESRYLVVMIEGTKTFFELDPAIALTTAFTSKLPGHAERRQCAKTSSRAYAAHLELRNKQQTAEDDDDGCGGRGAADDDDPQSSSPLRMREVDWHYY